MCVCESVCELCVSVGEELLILITKVSPFTTGNHKVFKCTCNSTTCRRDIYM